MLFTFKSRWFNLDYLSLFILEFVFLFNTFDYDYWIFCLLRHNDFPLLLRLATKNQLRNANLSESLVGKPDWDTWTNESAGNHVDIPRLREGRVGAQVRSTLTHVEELLDFTQKKKCKKDDFRDSFGSRGSVASSSSTIPYTWPSSRSTSRSGWLKCIRMTSNSSPLPKAKYCHRTTFHPIRSRIKKSFNELS
jgi:hypothetical protein